MKKLCILQIISKLVVTKPLIAIITLMHNFIVKFAQILEIYKKFAGNRVDKNGNRPHCGVVPKFSDLEVIALSATAEAFGIMKFRFAEVKSDVMDNTAVIKFFPNITLTNGHG